MNVGTSDFFNYQDSYGSPQNDPEYFLFTRSSPNPEHNGQPLLPIVVYRQQVANSAFPKVSGSLIQVTPLIEHLAWKLTLRPLSTTVEDLLIAAGNERIPFSDSWRPAYYIYLRDQQPVMIGASYHYFVMRMSEKHEIAEIIDAGIVTIPPN